MGSEQVSLTGGPSHGPTTQQVGMKMVHGLTRVWPLIDHKPVATGQIKLGRNLLRRIQNMKMVSVSFRQGIQPRNLRPWHNQYVDGGLRRNIFERHNMGIFINNFCRYFPEDYFSKKGWHGDYQVTSLERDRVSGEVE